MPRKAFRADLATAIEQQHFGNISQIALGEDDGEFTFLYDIAESGESVLISAMVSDVSAYPSSHQFHVFTTDHAPVQVGSALQDAPTFKGQSVQSFLSRLSNFLNTSYKIQTPSNDEELHDSDGIEETNEDWTLDDEELFPTRSTTTGTHATYCVTDSVGLTAHADLRAAKAAGFKVGVIGEPSKSNSCYVSIACRISKLGISEEATEAWNLDLKKYFAVLIYYPLGYQSLNALLKVGISGSRHKINMRVGISEYYKPVSIIEAQAAFRDERNELNPSKLALGKPNDVQHNQESNDDQMQDINSKQQTVGFQETLISRSLNELLNERLVQLLSFRLSMGLSWNSAERLFEKRQRAASKLPRTEEEVETNEQTPHTLPSLVTADEIKGKQLEETARISFPLVAMQFTLRHFVRCTEFCLVCHSKVPTEIEAIKPFVCDSPLCLFQYMNLRFGPNIEHEILSQPYVVDILISFCYAAAKASQLKTYPEGLGWSVPVPKQRNALFSTRSDPLIPSSPLSRPTGIKAVTSETPKQSSLTYKCQLDTVTYRLKFELGNTKPALIRTGQWLMVNFSPTYSWHARISDTLSFPQIALAPPIIRKMVNNNNDDTNKRSGNSSWTNVEVHLYDQNFDSLEKPEMNQSIVLLLDVLPSVQEMHQFLSQGPSRKLVHWHNRINSASLGLLRWIIASNRSCIVQVDQPKFLEPDPKKRQEERVQGIPSWLQFRFAMGAPDKEQRFLNAIAAHGNPQYKTLFAWHGSPLENWHSIIREGLRFDRIVHGRAYGNGCYLARDFSLSKSYSNKGFAPSPDGFPATWSQSILKINSAIALSEVVNAPHKYVCQHPYVIEQLDWIQTRYLFVLPMLTDLQNNESERLNVSLKQDPSRIPTGPLNKPIDLPVTAISKSRRPQNLYHSTNGDLNSQGVDLAGKGSYSNCPIVISDDEDDNDDNDDSASVDTEPDDRKILSEADSYILPTASARTSTGSVIPTPVTKFSIRPINHLPTMPLPRYATSSASNRLQKDYRKLQSTQALHLGSGTLADLGWYMDPEHIVRTENLYQWVIELHSFPRSLPLAADLEKTSMQSIILEMRFDASYPFSPPFVRIVRPRFLPFAQGGGGHVTAGGSICMDLLTASGWTAVSDIESVLLQIRMAIINTEPRPARLEFNKFGKLPDNVVKGHQENVGDYGIGEAISAFRRVATNHGWKIPESLNQIEMIGNSTDDSAKLR